MEFHYIPIYTFQDAQMYMYVHGCLQHKSTHYVNTAPLASVIHSMLELILSQESVSLSQVDV